jgi:hypothetical protein
MEVSPHELKAAIESQHGGKAILAAVEHVRWVVEGKTLWEGEIHVFDLENHPEATMAYAWSSSVDGGERRRLHAVLHLDGIQSPLDAVRAAIVAERKIG